VQHLGALQLVARIMTHTIVSESARKNAYHSLYLGVAAIISEGIGGNKMADLAEAVRFELTDESPRR
jgi:hypothetical protein